MGKKFIPKLSILCLLLFTVPYPAAAQSDYHISTSLDVLSGKNNTSARLRVAYGYSLTSDFTARLGTGFTLYDDPLSLLPLFVGIEYLPWEKQILTLTGAALC